jgi:hypothetical protein
MAVFLTPFQVLVSLALHLPFAGAEALHLFNPPPGWTAVEELASFGMVLILVQRGARRSWQDLLGVRPVPGRIWLPLLVGWVGLHLLMGMSAVAVETLLPPPAWLRNLLQKISLLDLLVTAPIVEEGLDRGVILGGFLRRYGRRRAVLLSALLFALAHLNPWQFPPALLFGLFAGWVFAWTRSIWPGVVMHLLHNGACCAEGWFWPLVPGEAFGLVSSVVVGMGLLCLLAGAYLLKVVFKSNPPQLIEER